MYKTWFTNDITQLHQMQDKLQNNTIRRGKACVKTMT